jgi:hypothetical protein
MHACVITRLHAGTPCCRCTVLFLTMLVLTKLFISITAGDGRVEEGQWADQARPLHQPGLGQPVR